MLTQTQNEFLTRYVFDPLIPEGNTTSDVSFASDAGILAARDAWVTARDMSTRQLNDLIAKLLSEDDPELAQVAVLVGRLAAQMPNGLAADLEQIAQQVSAGGTGGIGSPKGLVAAQDFLTANDAALGRCENNPLGAKVNIRKPMAAALDRVANALKDLSSS